MATISQTVNPSTTGPLRYSVNVTVGNDAMPGLEASWPDLGVETTVWADNASERTSFDDSATMSGSLEAVHSTAAPSLATPTESPAAMRRKPTEADAAWGGPMASFGWNQAALDAVRGEQTSILASARDGEGILRAVAPLAKSNRWTSTLWEMLGVGWLNEPTDFVYTDRASLAALVEGIIRVRRPLIIPRIPADSPTIELLRRAAAGRAIIAVRPQASCPFIPLDESWLVPENHFNSRRRSDYRRAIRRAERHGDLRAEVIAPQIDDLDRLLQTAFDIEARSWKGAAGTALACDSLRGGHLRQFARWAAQTGTLRMAILWIGREPVAMQIATEEAGRWWLLKIGFDPAWADCSPGTLLLSETVRYAARQRLKTYEFLGTVEPWTQIWTQNERRCVSVRVYPQSIRGAMSLGADALAICRRRIAAALQSRRRKPAPTDQSAGISVPPPAEQKIAAKTLE